VNLEPGSFKDAFMHTLRNVDVAVTAAAVRVLCGFLLNKAVDPDILDAAGARTETGFQRSLHAWASQLFTAR
jgi:hypothetical protein